MTTTISKSQVTVDTSEYRFSHGREPKGRGSWAFSEKRNPNYKEVKWYDGTYVQARRQAVTEAAANGITRIFAQP